MTNDPSDIALELSKLEYEKAADRYHNIYQSIWTIFSYMSAVSAALLAFGAERIEPRALAWVAPVPLIFWFWTTYLPLDRYGNRTLQRLRTIESRFNAVCPNARVGHFTGFARDHHSILISLSRTIRKRPKGCSREVRKQFTRARFAIWVSFLLLHVAAICMFSIWLLRTERRLFKEPTNQQRTVQSLAHQQSASRSELQPGQVGATQSGPDQPRR